MRTVWRRWRYRHAQRNWEVFLFNYGPVGKWRATRDLNSLTGVWRRWPL
jgi:hypothetical protein